jgi:hypothetical protein
MAPRAYNHSAYWKGKKTAKLHRGQPGDMFYTGEYLKSVNMRLRGFNVGSYSELIYGAVKQDIFNPFIFAAFVATDIGVAIKRDISNILDPSYRAEKKRELMQDLQKIRRPFYYARENERRRQLARERRKIRRRTTLSKMPSPEELLLAWNRRKESKEAMIRLGGMLQDLECFVDNFLRIDADGRVVGRNRGIKGWLAENLPELTPKYKTLMRYKAMAIKLRQATDTRDPRPTERLLRKPYHPIVKEILSGGPVTFAIVLEILEKYLSPDRIFDG